MLEDPDEGHRQKLIVNAWDKWSACDASSGKRYGTTVHDQNEDLESEETDSSSADSLETSMAESVTDGVSLSLKGGM